MQRKQPDQSRIVENIPTHMIGYYKISRHYKWALEQVFMKHSFTSVIITEGKIELNKIQFILVLISILLSKMI